MRKNGSRLVSIRQYRLTDMFLFAAILAVGELLSYLALIKFPSVAYYTVSFVVPVTLILMMRWSWQCVFHATLDGVLVCALSGAQAQVYAVYAIGNAFIMLMLLATKFFGKERIAGKWYFSALFVVLGWLAVVLGRCIVGSIAGINFVSLLRGFCGSELMSLVISVIVILVLRRFPGMFEDQKHYLIRMDNERKEKMRRDTFGDELVEIDEESLSILNKRDDNLY